MQISPYSDQNADEWDALIEHSPNATFLHTRRFLAYHKDRFSDTSTLLRNDKGKLVGVFPAAIDPQDDLCIVSHPGLTFGGLLHTGTLRGEQIILAFNALRRHYAGRGFKSLRYKTTPYIYHQVPAGDDLYALFRLGAIRHRCDLSCVIDLDLRPSASSRRKQSLKKAVRSGVTVTDGLSSLPDLWKIIEENLSLKIGEKPVHSLSEITQLHSLFPDNIRFLVGVLDGKIVAGLTLFISPMVTRTQYIASSSVGYDVNALDAVLEYAIQQASSEGRRYFDFGSSNRREGHELSANVYQFKVEFGGGGVAHEFYDLNLEAEST